MESIFTHIIDRAVPLTIDNDPIKGEQSVSVSKSKQLKPGLKPRSVNVDTRHKRKKEIVQLIDRKPGSKAMRGSGRKKLGKQAVNKQACRKSLKRRKIASSKKPGRRLEQF